MINFVKGDLLKNNPTKAWVNTCNTTGVMGKGIALNFKKQFPAMFREYKKYCNEGKLTPGGVYIYPHNAVPHYILNLATKNHWKHPSKLEWITLGLENLNEVIQELKIPSVSMPALGCSNGGLDWNEVKAEIIKAHDQFWQKIEIVVYQPRIL